MSLQSYLGSAVPGQTQRQGQVQGQGQALANEVVANDLGVVGVRLDEAGIEGFRDNTASGAATALGVPLAHADPARQGAPLLTEWVREASLPYHLHYGTPLLNGGVNLGPERARAVPLGLSMPLVVSSPLSDTERFWPAEFERFRREPAVILPPTHPLFARAQSQWEVTQRYVSILRTDAQGTLFLTTRGRLASLQQSESVDATIFDYDLQFQVALPDGGARAGDVSRREVVRRVRRLADSQATLPNRGYFTLDYFEGAYALITLEVPERYLLTALMIPALAGYDGPLLLSPFFTQVILHGRVSARGGATPHHRPRCAVCAPRKPAN